MEANVKSPFLRFQEFNDEWNVKTLGNLLEFKNGINASKEQYGSGVKFINILDILNNEFITYDNIIGSVDVSEDIVNKNLVNYGDILFQRSSETREEVGTASVYLDTRSATFGGFVIRGKKIGAYDPTFLNKLLKTKKAREAITSKSGGSTRYNVGQEILSRISVMMPDIAEQQKIASFLTAVDTKLHSLKKKKELLVVYKKGVMQKIFSQELRFKDDNEKNLPNWRIFQLMDIVEIKKGEQLNVENLSEFNTNLYPALNGGIDFSGYTEKWNTDQNTITISEGGNSCGYVNLIRERFWSGGHCYTLKLVNSEINNDFLYHVLKYKEPQIMRLRVGSGLPNIQKKDLNVFEILIPVYGEQILIAEFLNALDFKILNMINELKSLESWKKGLLQKLFV